MANESWTINGIEFEVGEIRDEKLVENPDFSDVYFFSPAGFDRCGESYAPESSELVQLVDEGYLERYLPAWLSAPCFSLRLKLDSEGKFEHDGSEPATCEVCGVSFNFTNDGSQLVQTAAERGPSYACGGTPAEYEPACSSCIDGE